MQTTRAAKWLILGMIGTIPAWPQIISTVASSSTWAGVLNSTLDSVGNLYVADWGGQAVYKVDKQAVITTIAGTVGRAGSTGDGAAATAATLNGPIGVAVDSAGNVFIACYGDHRIRKVSTTGIITTYAGNGRAGFSGDGGPASSAMLNTPLGLIIDKAGNLFLLDYNNFRIRKITPAGVISTFAGTGRKNSGGDGGQALATDMAAAAINFGPDGSLYYADASYRGDAFAPKVRRILLDGTVTTVGGNGKAAYAGDGGPAAAASFQSIDGVAVDPAGNVYAAEYNGNRIRKINVSTGVITTYAGNGRAGLSGDAGDPTLAMVSGPVGLMTDSQGSLYITEYANRRVRKVAVANVPSIKAADSGVAAFFGQAGFSSNMYMDITGNNLAQSTRTWTLADFSGADAPTSLDGVSVTMNGKAAFIRYVSPTQVGIIVPDDTTTGPVTIQLQSLNGPSNPGSVTRAKVSPTLQTASQFSFGGKQYVLAQTPDFRFFVGSPNIIGGFPISAVKPGDTIVVYALGCGPTDPATPAGAIAVQDSAMTLPFELRIGGIPAGVVSAGVVANTIGLYQFVVTVPAVAAGDQPVELVVDGTSNSQNLLLLIGQ